MKTLLLFFLAASLCFGADTVLKGSNGATRPATAGADFAPPTSGTAMLKGDGSGGTSSATAGTDYPGFALRTIVPILGIAIATSGSPADLQSGTITLPTGYTRYAVLNVWACTSAASGSLAIGTIDVRTAAGGGGSSIISAATALTSLTAVNLAQSITAVSLGTTYTSTTITVRQTINSLNAGTVAVLVEVLFLP